MSSALVLLYMTKYRSAPHKGLPQGGKRVGGDPNVIWHFQELDKSIFPHLGIYYMTVKITPQETKEAISHGLLRWQPGHVPDPEAVHKH